jgi:hypothetical protein
MGVLDGTQMPMQQAQQYDPAVLSGILFDATMATNANLTSSSSSSAATMSEPEMAAPVERKQKKRKREE